MIEPSLARFLEQLSDTEFYFMADEFTQGSHVPMVLGPDRKSLKELRLGYVRVSGTGIAMQTNQETEVCALVVFNAIKGSGGALPGFAGKVLHAARELGIALVLHRLAGGPVKLINTRNGSILNVYGSLPEAFDPYFSLINGNLFHVAQLDRTLSRLQSSRWMIGMAEESAGEMMNPEYFSPVRLSHELESHIGHLRSQRTEFGFVGARRVEGKPMTEALRQDAETLSMTWHEVHFVHHRPGTSDHGLPMGNPFVLVSMRDRQIELWENLNELAIKHRQDRILRVYGDGAIELVEPYHNQVMESFIDLHAGIRALAGALLPHAQLPMIELR